MKKKKKKTTMTKLGVPVVPLGRAENFEMLVLVRNESDEKKTHEVYMMVAMSSGDGNTSSLGFSWPCE